MLLFSLISLFQVLTFLLKGQQSMTERDRGKLTPAPLFPAISKLVLITFFGVLPSFAQAAQPDGDWTDVPIEGLLDMKVYSASRFVQDVKEAPSAVTILTASDIKTYGWRTLAEALRSLPGLYTSYDRNYTYLGSRGFLRSGDFNARFLLLIDGNRANDPIYDQARLGSDFALDIDLIDRIEYVPGPGSAVYGSNAFFGVINVITKRGRDLNGWQISGEAGNYGTRKGRVSHGWKNESGAELLLSATNFYREGKDLFYPEFKVSTSDGIARHLDYDRSQNVFLKGSAGPFTVSLVHSKRTKGTPTASYEQEFNAPGSKIIDEQTLASFDFKHALSSGTELSTRVFFNEYKFLGDFIYSNTPSTPPHRVNRDDHAARWWGGDVKILSTSLARHRMVAGLELQNSDPIKMDNYDVNPYLVKQAARHQNSRLGVYFQDEWQLLNDFMLNTGLRYDHNSAASGNNLNPRLGVIYQLSPLTTIKALYGKAYRLPNAYELYYAIEGDGGQKINPESKPEQIHSYEMVLEQRLSASSRLRFSAFRNKVTNLITLIEDPADGNYVFRNSRKATAAGLEAALEQGWRNGARLRTSYAWQRAKDDETGAILENSPRQISKLNFSIPFFHNQWRAGFETFYVSSRNTLNSQTAGHTLSNLTLFSDRLAKNVEVSASVYNLFDKRYADPVGKELVQESIVQDGRSFRIKLTYNF